MTDQPTPPESPAVPPDPPVLSYGRKAASPWPRRLLIGTVILAVVAAGLLSYRSVSLYFAKRAGVRAVNAWYQQARTSVIPPGTLLYSENVADFPATGWERVVSPTQSRSYIIYDDKFPALRQTGYNLYGAPTVFRFNVLFAHERIMWDFKGGKSPAVISVGYIGLDFQGRPQFNSMAFRIGNGEPPYTTVGGTMTVQKPPARSLKNLRIYAGVVDPVDERKFSLPFQCAGGTGRFDFQTDDDVSDGGVLTPAVTIAWTSTTSAPATQTGN